MALAPVARALPLRVLASPSADDEIEDELGRYEQQMRDTVIRMQDEHRETTERLARIARANGVELEQEDGRKFVARQPDRPGECEIVTPYSCTCRRFRVWHSCEHVALVLQTVEPLEYQA